MRTILSNLIFLNVSIIVTCASALGWAQDAQDAASMLQKFDEGRKAWLEEVEFYGSYTFRRNGFYSKDEAAEESIESNKYLSSTGIIAKKKHNYRLSVLQEKPPYAATDNVIMGFSSDIIANDKYIIEAHPDKGDIKVGSALNKVLQRPISHVIPNLVHSFTPLCLSLAPLSETHDNASLVEPPVMKTLENGQVLFTLKSKSAAGLIYVKQILINADEHYPTIAQISVDTFPSMEEQSSPIYSSLITVKEWKKIGDVSVPSRIRSLIGPIKGMKYNRDFGVASEWESKDIGERLPKDEDFTMKLDPEDHLNGMKTIPADHIYDINRITDDDFSPGGFDYGPNDVSPETNTHHLGIRLTLMILGLGVISWALFDMFKRKRTS